MNLYDFLIEELDKDENITKGVGLDKLLPTYLLNHKNEVKKSFAEWFYSNCEIERGTRLDFADYVPEKVNISDTDPIKWLTQNLDSLIATEDEDDSKKEEEESVEESKQILTGATAKSVILCHSTDDGEYYSLIWSRLDANDKQWIQFKEAYKKLLDKKKFDICVFAPYEM